MPLPANVKAVVAPQNTLGERNVVLYPPWKPGDRRIASGATIPLERTDLPVEIDDALDAFTKLTDALDSDKLGDVAGDLADGVGAAARRSTTRSPTPRGSPTRWPSRTSSSSTWPKA